MTKKYLGRVLCGGMILLSIFLSACASARADTLRFEAMDTEMSLTVYGGSDACEKLRSKALELDSRLSAVNEDSEIYALNASGTAELSAQTMELIQRSLELCRELDGAFDITVYPAVREWGFTTGDHKIPDAETLRRLADKTDWSAVRAEGDTVTLPEGFMIDLGAVAKGYLADKAKGILAQSGAQGAVLNLGGTVLLYGSKPDGKPFTIGIADPQSPASYFGVLTLGEGVAATSGGYERYFEKDGKRYIHILDPAAAAPVDNGVQSVTVFTDEGAAADALSTALFVMGADKAREYYRRSSGFEYALLTSDGRLYLSEGIAGGFTLCEGYSASIVTVEK